MKERRIVRQLLVRVDRFHDGKRIVVLPMDQKPDQVWIHADRGTDAPTYRERVCPTCGAKDHPPSARFCCHDGQRLAMGDQVVIIPFDRSHGYWLDIGHDWRWVDDHVRINNPGLETPGFWVICDYMLGT